MSNIIEVNGIKYIPKEKPCMPKVQNKGKSYSRMLPFMAMRMMLMDSISLMHDPFMPKVKKEPQRPDVNIIEEYGLIQLKKSNLSRSKRDWVVWVFERKYTKL